MQQRKAGRPSGTDDSDFSYRMVVDSRYTKVAKGKSRLKNLIFIQAEPETDEESLKAFSNLCIIVKDEPVIFQLLAKLPRDDCDLLLI